VAWSRSPTFAKRAKFAGDFPLKKPDQPLAEQAGIGPSNDRFEKWKSISNFPGRCGGGAPLETIPCRRVC
jgi:hypothetical protein